MVPASSPEPVDDYIASLPDARRDIVERIHRTITEAMPSSRSACGSRSG